MLSNNTKPEFEGMSDSQREMADRLVAEFNHEAMFSSYPQAFAGILHRSGSMPSVALYDADRCIDLIMEESSVELLEAEDMFSYGVLRGIEGQGIDSDAIIYFGFWDLEVYDHVQEIQEFDDAYLGLVKQGGVLGKLPVTTRKSVLKLS